MPFLKRFLDQVRTHLNVRSAVALTSAEASAVAPASLKGLPPSASDSSGDPTTAAGAFARTALVLLVSAAASASMPALPIELLDRART